MENTEIYEIIKSGPKKTSSPLNVWLLLGVSLFAFMGSGVFVWEIKFLVLLAIAILIHELGHLLAMRLYKYKNLKMMFLPLLGAVASGESKEQNAYKIAMISIFGPFIGFVSCIVAAILGVFTNEVLFFEYAYVSLFLNAFNLLPIMPLDGGQFLNETLFNRFPKAELGFKIIAIIGLSYLSYLFGSWIFGIIAFFMLFTIGISYKMANVARDLRKEADFKGGEITEEKIAKIRNAMKAVNPHFEKGKNINQLPNIINNMWLRVNKNFPSIPTTVFLVLVYFVVASLFSIFTWGFILGAQGNVSALQIAPLNADKPRE